MTDAAQYNAWEDVPNSYGTLKRFELPNKGYIYAAYEWVPPLFAEHGVIQNEHWRIVSAFFVPKGN